MIDLELLRREAQLLKDEWDNGQWLDEADVDEAHTTRRAKSNPGAVAERVIALIDQIAGGKVTIPAPSLAEAIDEATRNAKPGEFPVVCHPSIPEGHLFFLTKNGLEELRGKKP